MISIIMPVYNELVYTIQAIKSIEKHTDNYELIIVNDASTDGTAEYLSHINHKVITNEQNLGFVKSVNKALQATTNDVVIINNDVVVTPNWLNHLTSYDCDVTVPLTNAISGRQKDHRALYNSLETLELYANSLTEGILYFPRVTFFCVYIKRNVIDSIGLLDERFGIGNFDDDDFCLRAIQQGFKIGIALNSFVHHFQSVTFKHLNYNDLLNKNAIIFKNKWGKDAEIIWSELIEG